MAIVGGSGVDANTLSSTWSGVGSITINGNVYSGVLINNEYVLTAAHVVSGVSAGSISFNLNVGGDLTQTLGASAVYVNPSYTGTTAGADGFWHDDLALIKLSSAASSSATTYSLYTSTPKLGTTLTMVGYGYGGNGTAGVTTAASASVKRTGQNQVDELVVDDDGTKTTEIMLYDFDGPSSTTNAMGGTTLGANVEAQLGPGDSGSAFFVYDKGTWKLAGIASFIGSTSLSTISGNADTFGSIGGVTNVSAYSSWINSVITAVPEPHNNAMLLAGLALLGGLGLIRKRA